MVQRDELRVLQQLQRAFGKGGHVAPHQQRRGHQAPQSEMNPLLALTERSADFQHIHVVEMPVGTIGGQRQVLLDDVFHRFPVVADVTADAPRGRQIFRPCAGEGPTADVDFHILPSHLVDSFPDGGVTGLLLQVQFLSCPTIVNLDEVVAPSAEVQLRILLLVAVEPRTDAVPVLVPDAATGQGPGIRIDTRLQA